MAELVAALDFPTTDKALAMATELRGTAQWAKVGLELFVAEGPGIVSRLKEMDYKVFLDLKFLDIPNTVKGACRSAAASGADMMNIHALGGSRMAEAALEGLDMATPAGQKRPILIAVTVLTSMGPEDLPLAAGIDPSALALDLAVKAKQNALDGVVCSGLEVERIKAACGPTFGCLTPGIRPAGSDAGDQRRVVTPAMAVAAGADWLVAGRPITAAPSPREAALAILKEMNPLG